MMTSVAATTVRRSVRFAAVKALALIALSFGLLAGSVVAADGPSIAYVRQVSDRYVGDVTACESDLRFPILRDCVANALERYASALERAPNYLPKQTTAKPATIAEAARKVRQAKTKQQAIAAVRQASATFRRSIAEARREDPFNNERWAEKMEIIANALAKTEQTLSKAVGI